MGFFSSIAASVSTGASNIKEKNTLAAWEKMRKFDKNRLLEISEAAANTNVKMLSYILLSKFCNPSYHISNSTEILDKIKRFQKSDMLLLGEGGEWREIREYVNKMKSNGYLD